jgi:flavin-dependent dehydrogenase
VQRWGARQHFSIAPWSEFVEVYWGGGVEAYVTPCGEKLVGIAFLWASASYPFVEGGDRLIPSLMDAFPDLKKRLVGALPLDRPLATGPMHRVARSPVSDGVLLVGDAAGYLDAITGEGISLAVAQALALEQTVVPLLKAPKRNRALLTSRDLGVYAKANRKIARPYYLMTRLVLFLGRHPPLVEAAIRVLDRRPGLFQFLLSANMGLTPLMKW